MWDEAPRNQPLGEAEVRSKGKVLALRHPQESGALLQASRPDLEEAEAPTL